MKFLTITFPHSCQSRSPIQYLSNTPVPGTSPGISDTEQAKQTFLPSWNSQHNRKKYSISKINKESIYYTISKKIKQGKGIRNASGGKLG